ncbi:hypothetical protein AGLY_015599 [Aphis glycines]|uniref:BPTI/Kunitz inhibitor domain-containing protein n=1 Tax=Aphis glycines TaxID=307491 RepID=A0A6G0T0B8_APHGL|nr:hypothetical protein AGLY_015599 [Aphis glycines]
MFAAKPYILDVLGMMIFIITDTQAKDDRCHRPVTENCNVSEYYIDGWKYTGWYYHTELKICRPLYTPNGWHTCKENYELPEAREMCEDLCAESCVMANGAQGICMSNEICKMYNHKPPANKPCGRNQNCCAKVPDKGLLPFTGPVNDLGGIVQVVVRKKLTDPGYPRDAFSYIYFLPYHITEEGKRYK